MREPSRAPRDGLGRGDIALSVVMLLGLALPLMPLPGDEAARIEVRFHAAGMAEPRAFSVPTTRSACVWMASALAYEDDSTGDFTRVTCED